MPIAVIRYCVIASVVSFPASLTWRSLMDMDIDDERGFRPKARLEEESGREGKPGITDVARGGFSCRKDIKQSMSTSVAITTSKQQQQQQQ